LARRLLYLDPEAFSMNKQKMSALVFSITFGFAALAPACGLQPPVQNGGAAARDGIQVAVLRQSCSQTVETELPGSDLVETSVEVEVRNGTSAPISVHREAFRLGAPDGSEIKTSTGVVNAPLSVDPGKAQTFELRFMSRGGLSCSKEMALESPAAVIKGTEPVSLGAVKFVPAHALSGYGASAS
jgi:hypothetical protein